jgi:hypothetical protein
VVHRDKEGNTALCFGCGVREAGDGAVVIGEGGASWTTQESPGTVGGALHYAAGWGSKPVMERLLKKYHLIKWMRDKGGKKSEELWREYMACHDGVRACPDHGLDLPE